MRTSLPAILLAAITVATAQAAPAGWKTATDHQAKCQAQVPGTWVPGEYNLGMKDPGGSSTVLISNSRLNDLNMAKQVASSTMTVQKVFEDSPGRYWMAFADRMGHPDTNWYLAVTTGSYICAMQLTFDSHLSAADAKTIAMSLRKN